MLENSTVVVSDDSHTSTPIVITANGAGAPQPTAGTSGGSNGEVKIVTNEGASTFYANPALLKAKAPKLYSRAMGAGLSKLHVNPALFSLIIDYVNGAKTERDVVTELSKKAGPGTVVCAIELLVLAVRLCVSPDDPALPAEIIRFVTKHPAAMNPSHAVMVINYCEEFLAPTEAATAQGDGSSSTTTNSANVYDDDDDDSSSSKEVQERCRVYVGDIRTKAWNFFRYFTVDCLENTSSADIVKVRLSTLEKMLGLRWVNTSEDAIFTFIGKWVGLHLLASPDAAAERARLLTSVDPYRLSGPIVVGAAKAWLAAQSTPECDLYVRVLEAALLRDVEPLPPPLRIHGFFAIGPAAQESKSKPTGGFRQVSQQGFAHFFNLLVIQVRNDGGALPLLGLFPVASNTVMVAGKIPSAVPNPAYGATRERLAVRRVFFAETGKSENNGSSSNSSNSSSFLDNIMGWAAVSFGQRDVTESANIKAGDWTFDPVDPKATPGNSYALYVVDDVLPL